MSGQVDDRSFKYPPFFSFPPFFTIQPVKATRTKQLEQWRALILSYHSHYRLRSLAVRDCPLFENPSIDRSLTSEDILVILNDLVSNGRGEWEEDKFGGRTRCKILWRTPEEIADDLYDWAAEIGGHVGGGVCTVYELHSGEDVVGTALEGVDESLLRRAIAVLEERGKCRLFQGDTSDEDGVKFF
mmetsp:Transcript_16152/g.36339  ORF Transcript_16152/g.36339 Transcript_16152/m.36339 type:complete len:186 (-) Transcript_16152:304-861(-)